MTHDILLTKGEQTRSGIIQSAYRLFLDQGYHGTSMRQIARQAGIAVGGIYNHFSSKEDIFKAVFQEYHPYHDVIPAVSGAHGETAEELVRDAASRLLQALKNQPDFLKLSFIEHVEFRGIHSASLYAQILPQGTQLLQILTLGRIERIRDIPPLILVRAFIGLFLSYYLTDILVGQELVEFHQNDMDYFVDIFLHGILQRESGHEAA